MIDNNSYYQWEEACRNAIEYVKAAAFEDTGDIAIETAKDLLALAHVLKGVACSACSGRGEITYGDTSTWRRAAGAGQMLTSDLCERCWGTGRADKIGPDLRRIKSVEHQNEDLFLKNKSLAFEKLEYIETLIAKHEAEKAKIFLTIESFCQKCEYRQDPGSCEDCSLFSVTGGPIKK